jgi:hypothetical protein
MEMLPNEGFQTETTLVGERASTLSGSVRGLPSAFNRRAGIDH